MRNGRLPLTGAVACLLAAACVVSKDRVDSAQASRTPTDSTRPSTQSVAFGAEAFGPIRMCAPLDSVRVLAPRLGATAVRDTVLESEEERWPARILTFTDGSTALFESSWSDTTRVWRFSTTSPRARTAHGARVGATVGELETASGPVKVELPEGVVVLILAGDSVNAAVDTAAARAFVQGRGRSSTDTLRAPPASARLTALSAAGRCSA